MATAFQAYRVHEIATAQRVHWENPDGSTQSGTVRHILGWDDLDVATVVIDGDDGLVTTIPMLGLCDMLNNGEAATTREQ